jgi:hypothetical protein
MFHWESHYKDIQKDVDSGRDPALEMDVVAFALVESIPLIPSHADGPTLEEGCEEESDCVGHTEGHDAVGKGSKAFGRKNAKVEEQNGDLRDTEAGHVEDLSKEVVEQYVGDLLSFQRVYISSETVFDHCDVVSKGNKDSS